MKSPTVATASDICEKPGLRSDIDGFDLIQEHTETLCSIAAVYLEPSQVELIRKACYFAAECHDTQYRKSGEPYVTHPISVSIILAEVRFDHETLLAAILHDVIEDTSASKEDLARLFGEGVAELVDGVSKLDQIRTSSKAEVQAGNFRKMFLAMAKDLRVIMVKLADRLHNMRTLASMRPDKRRKISRETLDIYAPIAGRLGMNALRLDLETLGFQHLYPDRYRVLAEALRKRSGKRQDVYSRVENRIAERLVEVDIQARVEGREKHLWGIYQKMRAKHLSFDEVLDVYALRVIVDTVDECYRVLGLVHSLYKPLLGRFKDYIAIPKANGYQSLHTVLFGPQSSPIEVQIRTREMHLIAEAGVAAHWRYKSDGKFDNSAQKRAREWLKRLSDMQRRSLDSVEFLESVKVDLFPDEVYVFTPAGEIIELPRGATVIDFAYAIHSDVGNTCVAAKVNRRMVPLRSQLSNGQTVEVIISPTGRPNPAWMGFVATAKARNSIRHYLKQLQREDAVILGKRMLERELRSDITSIAEIETDRIDQLLSVVKAKSFNDVLAGIGLGERLAALTAKRLYPENEQGSVPVPETQPGRGALMIRGAEGEVVNFGRCCYPLPGDSVVGFLSAGRGMVIHRTECKNTESYQKHPDKWLEVEWEERPDAEFPVEIRVETHNTPGVLAAVAAAIAAAGSNIENINTPAGDSNTLTLAMIVTVHNRTHLAEVMVRLRRLEYVIRITRHP